MAISATFLFPVLSAILFLKMVAVPVRSLLRLCLHSVSGLLCLWILNGLAGFSLPINAVTVVMAGFGGLPGIGLVALLSVI